jgi:ABC-type nitrate/sulfonate/bicarbonate transport system substrate-binding protein
MRISRRVPQFTLLPALLSVCLLFPACTPKTPPPVEKVTVAVPANLYATFFFVAQEKGFFREEGLDVKLNMYPQGKDALDNMVAGGADIAVSAETPVMFTILRGGDVVIVASVLESGKDQSIIAWRSSGVKTPRDLKGKRIGVAFGTNGEYFLDTFLAVNGIPRNSVKIVNTLGTSTRDGLKAGMYDAVSAGGPTGPGIRKEFGAEVVTFFGDSIYTVISPVTVRREFSRSRPAAVRKLLRALLRADEFTRKDSAGALEITARGTRIDREILQLSWPMYEFEVKLDQSLMIGIENQARWAIRNRLVSAKEVPDFLRYVDVDSLKAEKPEVVTVIR